VKQPTYTEEQVRKRVFAHFKEHVEDWERELNIAYMAASSVSSGPSETLVKSIIRFVQDNPAQNITVGKMYGLEDDEPQADLYFDLNGLPCRLLFTVSETDGDSILANTGAHQVQVKARKRYADYKSQQ
jgi:hypothetical protein